MHTSMLGAKFLQKCEDIYMEVSGKVIDHRHVEIALQHVSGEAFESFVNAFYPALMGVAYVPLGGVKDGGADALMDLGVMGTDRPGAFFQASVQDKHVPKIRQTVERLKEVGREPKSLTYVTSQTIRMIDSDEQSLSEETGVFIRIRDGRWIVAQINHSAKSTAAFESYLRPCLSFLNDIGGARIVENPEHLQSRAVCVFLGQEVERRRSKSSLLESVTDSLILWSLEGTDPDKGLFKTRNEIQARIEEVLPTARHFIGAVLDHRLRALAQKSNTTGREIRHHRKENKYCLPYETRKAVEDENTEDELLRSQVLKVFEGRAQESDEPVSPVIAARVALRAVELTFETQGLELAAFLHQKDASDHSEITISDQVDKAIDQRKVKPSDGIMMKVAVMGIIRKGFYESTEEERQYFAKLSRTYSLLFSLQAEPRIVEYFQSMSSNLVLFVGTDMFIRALSERYLRPEDRMTCNMLEMLKSSGADLLLAQPVVDEVHRHLQISDSEFHSDFAFIEPHVDVEIARHSSKILVRAYFYAKLGSTEGIDKPRGWKSFIGQVCDYGKLFSAHGNEQTRKYLLERFKLDYVSADDISELTNANAVEALTKRLVDAKNTQGAERILAENDAKMVLCVYGKRKTLKEQHKANPYGFRTWWLTHESKVLSGTVETVRRNSGLYMMRPEFLVNFIALSPTTEEVRHSYDQIFPTLLGVKLSNRMRDDVFHNLMAKVKDTSEVDEARAKVMMGELSDKLKADRYKQYEVSLTTA